MKYTTRKQGIESSAIVIKRLIEAEDFAGFFGTHLKPVNQRKHFKILSRLSDKNRFDLIGKIQYTRDRMYLDDFRATLKRRGGVIRFLKTKPIKLNVRGQFRTINGGIPYGA